MSILYYFLSFLIGFLIAWLVKKQSPAITNMDVESIKQNTALEIEKSIAVANNTKLQGQLETLQHQLRIASNEVADKAARIDAEVNAAALLRKESAEILKRFNETFATINKLEKEISYSNAQLKYKDEQLQNQKTEIENIGKRFETEFKVLAQKYFERKDRSIQ